MFLANSGYVDTDSSKAYDCVDHAFLIAKLEACSLDKFSLDLLTD